MNEYQYALRRAERCRRCAEKTVHDATMRSIWLRAANTLEKKAREMTIEAGERVKL